MRSGLSATQITNFAKQKKVDLVVMGAHGRSVLDRLILGSVADKVIRQATCPVLVIRGQESIEKDEEDKVEDKR